MCVQGPCLPKKEEMASEGQTSPVLFVVCVFFAATCKACLTNLQLLNGPTFFTASLLTLLSSCLFTWRCPSEPRENQFFRGRAKEEIEKNRNGAELIPEEGGGSAVTLTVASLFKLSSLLPIMSPTRDFGGSSSWCP